MRTKRIRIRNEAAANAAENGLQTLWRSLWRQHIDWARMTMESMAAGKQDAQQAGAGLLRNAQDMADALQRQYGPGLATGFGCLMRGHIWIALRIMEATRAGDKAAVGALEQERYANANEIAAYLAAINPFLPVGVMTELIRQHQQITGMEVVAIFRGDAAAAQQAYQQNLAQSIVIADTMAAAIARQFPG